MKPASLRPFRAVCIAACFLAGAARASAATHLITVGDNFFSPSSKSIAVGDTVTWTNSGFAIHNVTSTGPAFFTSSANFGRGNTYTFTFNASGTFNYTCTIHFNQNGTIIVTNVPVNQPPTVAITAPTNNMRLLAGSNPSILVNAADNDGTVQRVEFYESVTNLIGIASNAPFTLPVTNLPAGNFSLTARAFDNLGASSSSAAVAIQVLSTNTTLVADLALAAQSAFTVNNAVAGQTYIFESLTNLAAGSFASRWFPVSTNVASGSNFVFTAATLTNVFPRLYRVRQDY